MREQYNTIVSNISRLQLLEVLSRLLNPTHHSYFWNLFTDSLTSSFWTNSI